MAYYNRNLEKFDQSQFGYLNHGSCAHIAYDNRIIFKQYFSFTKLKHRLTKKMFEMLNDINNPVL